jgi:hypothetical protein
MAFETFDDQEFNQTEGETSQSSQEDPFVNLKVVGSVSICNINYLKIFL